MNRMGDLMGETIMMEMSGPYRRVYDELLRLEADFPQVAKNHRIVSEHCPDCLGYAQANLLWMLQPDTMNGLTRKEIRDHIEALAVIPGVRTVIITLVSQMFSSTIYMVEYLFFLNREVERRIKDGSIQGYALQDVLYPAERVDQIVNLAYQIMREAARVPQNTEQ